MNSISVYPPGCKDIQIELSNDELVRRLKKIQQAFQNLDQSADEKYKELAVFLGSEFFLEHHNEDIQLLVACCLADIFRINAPDSPFQDPNNLKNIFMFLATQLKGLKDASSHGFKRCFYLLENLECVKTFLVCQELDDSQEIIVNLFDIIFKIINEKITPRVETLLFELLHPLLNDADQISTKVLDILFARIIEPARSNNKEAYNLAVNLIKRGNQHFEYLVQNHLNSISLTSRSHISQNLTISNALNDSSFTGNNLNDSNTSDEMSLLNNSINDLAGQSSEAATAAGVHGASNSNQFITDKLCLIIYELNTIRPALLELVMPQLEYKLKSNDHKERREYTRLLSKMFSEKDSKLSSQVPQLWEAYLERFADMNEDIRKICIQHISDFLVQQASNISKITPNTSILSHGAVISTTGNNSFQLIEQIIEQVKNRSLDPDESLRFEVVQEILKAIRIDTDLITGDLLNILQKRTLDVKIKIRKAALQGLAQLYKKVHSKNNTRKIVRLHNWIPSTIMKIYFQDSIEDKLMVERLLNSCIVPYSLGAKEKMAQLYYAFTTFDDYSIMSLIEIMKNRVLLYQLMKSIIEHNEMAEKNPEMGAKLNEEISQVSAHLLDTAKGTDFMKVLLNLFKKNLNLKNYFKAFVNVNSSCAKTLQMIQLIFTNLNTLNATQMSMGKRLIERMSSLIIDRDCLESLIDLVEYKIKQKLTPEQRRMLRKRRNQSGDTGVKKANRRPGNKAKKNEDSNGSEEESSCDEDLLSEESCNELENLGDGEEEDGESDNATEISTREDSEDFKELLKHIDDDGEKGLKLITTILLIHQNYGFANPTTYQKLFAFASSRKDHIVSADLKILSNHFTQVVRASYTKEEKTSFAKANKEYLEKLKYLTLNGKPKQVKYAIYVIFNNFEKSEYETILHELYEEMFQKANEKKPKTFITSLIGLGHIAYLIPHLVAKEMKDFVVTAIAKDLLLKPATAPLNISSSEMPAANSSNAERRKKDLKLAGKWCEDEDELPFNTRARIEGVKLITRWCLGLRSECTNITVSLRLLTKLIKDNSLVEHTDHSDETLVYVSESERSRVRSVCGNQLLKLAQENCFKPLVTAEYFHVLSRLVIDPVTNVRDILIKKLNKGMQSNKLPIYYMSIFSLSGLDSNRERRARIKKIYSALITRIRLIDAKNQKKQLESNVQRTRILPEMCLPYAVSLLAHNVQIDSLKDETKVKQVKECMAVILDPLIEKPDSYQMAYIKKVLNKIKISDDGLAAAAITTASNSTNQSASANKTIIHNLYSLNKKLCLICEVFLFHLHSKSTTYLTSKEYEFDVKLPHGFYAIRDVNSESSGKIDRFNSDERMEKEAKDSLKNKSASSENSAHNSTEEIELDKENVSAKPKAKSKIEIVSRKRTSAQSEPIENLNASKSPEKSNGNSSPPNKRNKLNAEPVAKRAIRGKAAEKIEAIASDESQSEEEKKQEDVEEEEEAPKGRRSAGRKAAVKTSTTTTPVANKIGAHTKSSKLKEEVSVTTTPVRSSSRTTRASAK